MRIPSNSGHRWLCSREAGTIHRDLTVSMNLLIKLRSVSAANSPDVVLWNFSRDNSLLQALNVSR